MWCRYGGKLDWTPTDHKVSLADAPQRHKDYLNWKTKDVVPATVVPGLQLDEAAKAGGGDGGGGGGGRGL